MSCIGLSELGDAELLNRLDQKFIIQSSWAPALLESAMGEYCALEVNGRRTFQYGNKFFDTPDFSAFDAHVRGRNIRWKSRIRHYGPDGDAFLEVKSKDVHGWTDKERRVRTTDDWDATRDTSELAFLEEHFPYEGKLTSPLRCSFDRMTLVGTNRIERITIDSNIRFFNHERSAQMTGLSILEAKQLKIQRNTPVLEALRRFRYSSPPLGRDTRFSKYVVGMSLTHPDLNQRTYKPLVQSVIHLIEKNQNNES